MRPKASSVSQVGLDAATVLFSFMGGVPSLASLVPVVRLVANRRLHSLLFVYTPNDVTSGGYLGITTNRSIVEEKIRLSTADSSKSNSPKSG